MDIKPYFVDDAFPDLSKFDGLSDADLDELIGHLERKGKERKKRCEGMSKAERLEDFKRSEKEDEDWVREFREKKLKTAAV